MLENSARLQILQNNLHKCRERTHAILNDPDTKEFTMLMLQEQYWSEFTKSSPVHHSWLLYEPIGTTSEKHPRSAIYVNARALTAAQIMQLPIPSADITAIQISTQGTAKPSLFINVYNPSDDSALPALQQSLRQILPSSHYDSIIMAGDFNCHHPMWNPPQYRRHDEEADKLVDLATDLSLTLLIPPGTVTFPAAKTAIDLVWANGNASAKMVKCGIAANHDQGSDHLPIETLLVGDSETTRPPDIPSFNYEKTDWEQFTKSLHQSLPQVPHQHVLWSTAAIDRYAEQLTTAVTSAIMQSTPYRKPSPHSKRWWTPELTELRRQANRMRNLYRRTHSPIDKEAWEEKAAKYTEGIARAKKEKWQEFVENADGKTIWQIQKYASNIATSPLIPTLDGKALTHDDKVNAFTKTFFPQPPPANLNDIAQQPKQHLAPSVSYNAQITIEQIRTAVQKTNPKKAPGPDGISNLVIRQALPHIERHLQVLMQASLDMGYFPKAFRTSTTIVLRKPAKPDYTKAKAYRPIALENTLGKILESVMATMISYLTEAHELLPKGHYGARPGRSTEDAMMVLSESIHKAWKEGKIFTAVFLDVAGAFNNVHHDRLLYNLRCRGIPEPIARWIESFLTNRSTRLQFNGAVSHEISVSAGVPQGSPLSPLLYLYYNAGALEAAEGRKDALGIGFVDDIVYGISGMKDKGNTQKLTKILGKAE